MDAIESRVQLLGRELKASHRSGASLRSDDLVQATTLLGLPAVRDIRVGSSNQLDSAFELLMRAIRRLPPTLRTQARILFGLTASSSGQTLQVRRNRLGGMLGITGASFRTERELGLCELIAHEILALDAKASHHVNRRMLVDHPLKSRLNVDWLPMSRLYSRTETAVVALAAYIGCIFRCVQGEKMRSALDEYMQISLYWFTMACVLEELRYSQFGGNWLLADPDDEEVAADAFYEITFGSIPFSERQISRLRILLRSCDDWEVEPFISELETTAADLLAIWKTWVEGCHCPRLDLPETACEVHSVLESVETFSQAIRSHWTYMQDWYVSVADSPRDPLDPLWEE